MTRDDELRRLRLELDTGTDGVFVIGSARSPVLGGAVVPLQRLLDAPSIERCLVEHAGDDPVEVLADEGIPDEWLRSLNHRRDQLRIGRPVLLVFHPRDCVRLSRIADDLWKWATVIELDPIHPPLTITAAHGEIEADRYAPALDPGEVVGPRGPLVVDSEESIP